MQIIDLSHSVKSGDLVFEGMKSPDLRTIRNVKENGSAVSSISIYSHNGTHIDAPAHMIEDGKALTDFPVTKFYGRGMQIPCQEFANKEIPLTYLKKFKKSINDTEFIILNSGWSHKWNTHMYFDHFPILTKESASWLGNFNLKGIGIDMISIDHIKSQSTPIHKILLGKEILIIENLTNLDVLGSDRFIFQCLPIKFDKIDGSPIRAIAILE